MRTELSGEFVEFSADVSIHFFAPEDFNRITRYANSHAVDHWMDTFDGFRINPFERMALQNFFEAMNRLLRHRDAVDAVRDVMDTLHPNSTWWHRPTARQQAELADATFTFFATYYSTLSALSGVVARFSGVFGANLGDNGPFLKWVRQSRQSAISHAGWAQLERARLFRAILEHPQQFPVFDWATQTRLGYEMIHVVIFGPAGRGKNPTPRGAVGRSYRGAGDWYFEALDEASVTNSVFNLSISLLAEIVARCTRESGLRATFDEQAAKEKLIGKFVDASYGNSRVTSARDREDLPPADQPLGFG